MNHVTNWIQEDDFNLLHNMRGAKFSSLDSMRGAKCTICKAIDMLKIDCFARKNQFTGALLAFHANIWLYGRIFHNSRIFLQNINISDRIRFKTAQYCWFVSKFCTGMSVHATAWRCWTRGGITPIPTSIAPSPRLCCRVCAALQSVQIVQSASLHSIVFLVSART